MPCDDAYLFFGSGVANLCSTLTLGTTFARFLISLSLSGFAASVHAKCVDATIQVSGQVVSTIGSALANAKVAMEWSEIGGSVNRVATVTIDSEGRFSTPIVF